MLFCHIYNHRYTCVISVLRAISIFLNLSPFPAFTKAASGDSMEEDRKDGAAKDIGRTIRTI